MFKDFLTALLHKITVFLTSHKDFFEHKESAREKMLENLSIPEAFKTYLLKISGKEFLKYLEIAILYLEDPKGANIKNNGFFKSVLEFFSKDLARKIDYLDSNYYLTGKEKRSKFVEQLIKGDSILAQSLRTILINYNYQQIAEKIYELANKTEKTPFIVVQSPREI